MDLQALAQDLSELTKRERFMYFVELGDELEAFSEEYKTAQNTVPGCTSLAYIRAQLQEDNTIVFSGDAAAKAVRGYIYILTQALSNKTPKQVCKDTSIQKFIAQAQMNVPTQVSRSEAFGNIYSFIKQQARLINQDDA